MIMASRHAEVVELGKAGLNNSSASVRRHDLSLNLVSPAKDTLVRAIEIVRKDKPDFLPIYDRAFFGS